MKIAGISVFVLLFIFKSFGQTIYTSSLEIIPVEDEILDTSLPEIPWIEKDLKPFYDSEPLFSISSEDSETAAKGWVSVNKDEINIRVVVRDVYNGPAIEKVFTGK